jgi:hypothetical protein
LCSGGGGGCSTDDFGQTYLIDATSSQIPVWDANEPVVQVSAAQDGAVFGLDWDGGFVHWTGTSWQGDEARAVWALTRDDVWTASTGVIRHWDGSRWSEVRLSDYVRRGFVIAIWGSASDDVWAVGSSGM